MGKYQWFWGVVAAFISTFANASNCEAIFSIGKITNIIKEHPSSNVVVLRANCNPGERLNAYNYQLIYEGDRIHIPDSSQVIVSLAKGEKQTFTQDTNHLSITGKTLKAIHEDKDKWHEKIESVKIIWKLFETSRVPIPRLSTVRGSVTKLRLSEDRLLPSGTQYLPTGYDQIALLWRGGPAIVAITTTSENIEINTKHSAYLVAPISGNPSEIKVKLANHTIEWLIQLGKTPPTVPGLPEPKPESTAERLISAVWILKQGPKEWRLFALTELARLADAGYFPAEELWHAALSGELTKSISND